LESNQITLYYVAQCATGAIVLLSRGSATPIGRLGGIVFSNDLSHVAFLSQGVTGTNLFIIDALGLEEPFQLTDTMDLRKILQTFAFGGGGLVPKVRKSALLVFLST
jgi:hypothetical protein